jgi:preprotein translocase subunit SecB
MIKKMNYKIIAKYIKSLNFNISKPDKFVSLTKDISNYKFKIDIKSNRYKDNVIEVQTTLVLEPKDSNFDKIDALVTYSTLVEIDKDLTDKKRLEEIILIEIPNKIYPELRKVFIFIFESSGFREIKIDQVVDFKKLYLSKKN